MKSILSLLLASFLTAACSSSTTPLRVVPPADLTQACDPLPAFRGVTMGDLFRHTITTTQMYRECKARHDALSSWERAKK
ncbi:Rz1-like lysis system protein LysC [Limnoglobus roseus]